MKQKHDKDNGVCYTIRYIVSLCFLHYTVTHNDILYTGMMYHERKGEVYWKSMYTVVRDLDALKQVYIIL